MTITTTFESLSAMARGRVPYGMGIASRVTLSVQALNNEGSRNNTTIPRQVNIATQEGVVQVNAISGDTLKHAFVDYLRGCALDASDPALPLCDPCKTGSANRSNDDPTFKELARTTPRNIEGNRTVLHELARRCLVDDVAGLLVTEGMRNAPRPSRVHFGWQVGLPERVRTGLYTHVKLVPGAGEEEAEAGETGSNLGQNVFTRPASSGDYALVVRLDLDKVGIEDIRRTLVVDDAARRKRVRAAIEALYHTISAPDGAQVNTQLPHLHGVQGAVSVAFTSVPASLVSPLQDDFVEQMRAVSHAFSAADDQVVIEFGTVGDLGEVLSSVAGLFNPTVG